MGILSFRGVAVCGWALFPAYSSRCARIRQAGYPATPTGLPRGANVREASLAASGGVAAVFSRLPGGATWLPGRAETGPGPPGVTRRTAREPSPATPRYRTVASLARGNQFHVLFDRVKTIPHGHAWVPCDASCMMILRIFLRYSSLHDYNCTCGRRMSDVYVTGRVDWA